jgi:alginate O-acetyltransferase complex protein AlgI
MSITVTVPIATTLPRTLATEVADVRVSRATTDPVKYLALLAQLAALGFVFHSFRLETPAFLLLGGVVVAGFAVHYWLPFALKEPFWLLLSVGGAFILMEPLAATLLLVAGAAFFGVVASPLSYRARVGIVLAMGLALMYARGMLASGLPAQFWPVFGAIFMFRMMVYLYDLRQFKTRPSFREYVGYFFLLPNYYFLLFPVIDFQTLKRSYFQRDIHVVAQQGVSWILRGAIQLTLYRLVYHLKGPSNAPEAITTFGALASAMVLTYLLYLRVSGQFHIIIGILHLFGYDLPETNRRYLLARSLTDFWRRINIYWKDFMVKLVYFPVYFRMRRSGEVRAQVVATVCVFAVTWFLHSYQWFWLRGEFLFTWPDALFWGILGLLVSGNLLIEQRQKQTPRPPAGRSGRLGEAARVAGTLVLIITLWSMWNAPTLNQWLDVLTWWKVG